jgi:hypothetical protein
VKPPSGFRHFDAPGHLELVTAERNHADRHASGERFEGDAHAAMRDDAGGAIKDCGVGQNRSMRALAGAWNASGSSAPVVAITSTSSSARASRAVAISLSSRWYTSLQIGQFLRDILEKCPSPPRLGKPTLYQLSYVRVVGDFRPRTVSRGSVAQAAGERSTQPGPRLPVPLLGRCSTPALRPCHCETMRPRHPDG